MGRKYIAGAVALAMNGCAGPIVRPVEPYSEAFLEGLRPCTQEARPVHTGNAKLPHETQDLLMAGQRGWAVVQYDIKPDGLVANARIRTSTPKGVFDDAAINMVEAQEFARNDPKSNCGTQIEFRWNS